MLSAVRQAVLSDSPRIREEVQSSGPPGHIHEPEGLPQGASASPHQVASLTRPAGSTPHPLPVAHRRQHSPGSPSAPETHQSCKIPCTEKRSPKAGRQLLQSEAALVIDMALAGLEEGGGRFTAKNSSDGLNGSALQVEHKASPIPSRIQVGCRRGRGTTFDLNSSPPSGTTRDKNCDSNEWASVDDPRVGLPPTANCKNASQPISIKQDILSQRIPQGETGLSRRRAVSLEKDLDLRDKLTDHILQQRYVNAAEFFEPEKEIGRGMSGVVWQCVERSSGKKWACKLIPKSSLLCHLDTDALVTEVRVMHLLSHHQSVVQLRRIFEDSENVHLVMEFCEGGDLFDRIKQRKRYHEEDAAVVCRTLAALLADCHDRGIMHRDLKPENILLPSMDSDVDIRVADWGSAAFCKQGEKLNQLVGSAMYMAPCVLEHHYGHEADVWSLGVILHILLSGVPPFWGTTNAEIFKKAKAGQLDLEKGYWKRVSPEAKDLVRRLVTMDSKQQLSARQVLSHPWILEHCPEVEPPPQATAHVTAPAVPCSNSHMSQQPPPCPRAPASAPRQLRCPNGGPQWLATGGPKHEVPEALPGGAPVWTLLSRHAQGPPADFHAEGLDLYSVTTAKPEADKSGHLELEWMEEESGTTPSSYDSGHTMFLAGAEASIRNRSPVQEKCSNSPSHVAPRGRELPAVPAPTSVPPLPPQSQCLPGIPIPPGPQNGRDRRRHGLCFDIGQSTYPMPPLDDDPTAIIPRKYKCVMTRSPTPYYPGGIHDHESDGDHDVDSNREGVAGRAQHESEDIYLPPPSLQHSSRLRKPQEGAHLVKMPQAWHPPSVPCPKGKPLGHHQGCSPSHGFPSGAGGRPGGPREAPHPSGRERDVAASLAAFEKAKAQFYGRRR